MILLRKAENIEEVEAILKDPEIFGRVAEDGHDLESFEIDMSSNCFMLIEKDSKIIGVWCIYPVNKTTLNIHCNILKEHREHGKESGRLILKWFAEESPEQYQKLNAEIPVIYTAVYHFTKNFGFQDEGINRKSISKEGQLVDQYRLGITREEVKNGIR